MKPSDIINQCSTYFIKYFGTEHKHRIEDRLHKSELYFVNESNHDDCVKQHILNSYKCYGQVKCGEYSESERELINNVEKVVNPDAPNVGHCVLMTCLEVATGKLFDVSRGIFIFDYYSKSYKTTQYGAYSDTCIFHELGHAITQFAKDQETYNGFEGYDKSDIFDIFNEYFIETIAVDLSKMMHRDGKTFNENIPLRDKVYDISKYKYFKKPMSMLRKSWDKDMKYLKHAIITCEHDNSIQDIVHKLLKSL